MNTRFLLRLAILVFWTLFWGLSVVDKILPDVQHLWVGKDFFALFIKFFASLGLKDPVYATVALAGVSALEAAHFVLYLLALSSHLRGEDERTRFWFFRAIMASMVLFSLFSIADQVFGDRFQLLEHGLFWLVLLASWFVFRFIELPDTPVQGTSAEGKRVVVLGTLLTAMISVGLWDFSEQTWENGSQAVSGKEVVDGIYKFDFPFLADKRVLETTVNTFKAEHPELDVTYVYTGPSELNTKKKTHVLVYLFTEPQSDIQRR